MNKKGISLINTIVTITILSIIGIILNKSIIITSDINDINEKKIIANILAENELSNKDIINNKKSEEISGQEYIIETKNNNNGNCEIKIKYTIRNKEYKLILKEYRGFSRYE